MRTEESQVSGMLEVIWCIEVHIEASVGPYRLKIFKVLLSQSVKLIQERCCEQLASYHQDAPA